MNTVLFVLLDQFADFEYGPIASVINRSNSFRVQTVSITKQPITSIGGLTVIPDLDVQEVLDKEVSGIVLIGGDSWRNTNLDALIQLIDYALDKHVVIASICDACTLLARMGVLNDICHTANQVSDLIKISDNYKGQSNYLNQQVVTSGNIITANGTASYEFAKAILSALNVMSQVEIDNWYDCFTLGYYAMQASRTDQSWIASLMNKKG